MSLDQVDLEVRLLDRVAQSRAQASKRRRGSSDDEEIVVP